MRCVSSICRCWEAGCAMLLDYMAVDKETARKALELLTDIASEKTAVGL